MKIWRVTKTLDGLIDDVSFCGRKADAEFLLVGGKAIDLDEFPRLRGIFKTGIGTDNLPFDEAADRGIRIGLPDEQTREFFDAEKLSWMKNGAALVNTARGPIVSEEALFDELSAGRLFAAFDVFWQEPYRGKLKALHPDPFYMTPHVASTCREFLEGTAKDFRRFLKELESDS